MTSYPVKGDRDAFIKPSLHMPSKKLETCIDCGKPVAKPSPILGRLCDCRNAESD